MARRCAPPEGGGNTVLPTVCPRVARRPRCIARAHVPCCNAFVGAAQSNNPLLITFDSTKRAARLQRRAPLPFAMQPTPIAPPFKPDDHSEVVPLLPIPNRTVKRLCADDSAGSRVKVGHRQATYSPAAAHRGNRQNAQRPRSECRSGALCFWDGKVLQIHANHSFNCHQAGVLRRGWAAL